MEVGIFRNLHSQVGVPIMLLWPGAVHLRQNDLEGMGSSEGQATHVEGTPKMPLDCRQNRRHRHGMQSSDTYALCDQAQEMVEHLFGGCSTTKEVWFTASAAMGIRLAPAQPTAHLGEWWLQARWRCPGPRKGFDSLSCSYHGT